MMRRTLLVVLLVLVTALLACQILYRVPEPGLFQESPWTSEAERVNRCQGDPQCEQQGQMR